MSENAPETSAPVRLNFWQTLAIVILLSATSSALYRAGIEFDAVVQRVLVALVATCLLVYATSFTAIVKFKWLTVTGSVGAFVGIFLVIGPQDRDPFLDEFDAANLVVANMLDSSPTTTEQFARAYGAHESAQTRAVARIPELDRYARNIILLETTKRRLAQEISSEYERIQDSGARTGYPSLLKTMEFLYAVFDDDPVFLVQYASVLKESIIAQGNANVDAADVVKKLEQIVAACESLSDVNFDLIGNVYRVAANTRRTLAELESDTERKKWHLERAIEYLKIGDLRARQPIDELKNLQSYASIYEVMGDYDRALAIRMKQIEAYNDGSELAKKLKRESIGAYNNAVNELLRLQVTVGSDAENLTRVFQLLERESPGQKRLAIVYLAIAGDSLYERYSSLLFSGTPGDHLCETYLGIARAQSMASNGQWSSAIRRLEQCITDLEKYSGAEDVQAAKVLLRAYERKELLADNFLEIGRTPPLQ